MELHRGFLNNKYGTCRGERGRRQEVSGMDKGKSALQWEAKTEELGFIHKFCLMKLHPSLPAIQLAEAGLRTKGKVFPF